MATTAMYGLSGDALLKPMVDKAVQFILKAQNPGMGWRHGVKPGDNDRPSGEGPLAASSRCAAPPGYLW